MTPFTKNVLNNLIQTRTKVWMLNIETANAKEFADLADRVCRSAGLDQLGLTEAADFVVSKWREAPSHRFLAEIIVEFLEWKEKERHDV